MASLYTHIPAAFHKAVNIRAQMPERLDIEIRTDWTGVAKYRAPDFVVVPRRRVINGCWLREGNMCLEGHLQSLGPSTERTWSLYLPQSLQYMRNYIS
jgi:hypothetical protein